MREIDVSRITEAVKRMCISSNYHLPEDIRQAIATALEKEDGSIARGILQQLVENEKMASEREVPICQDTGMACVFLEVGQDVHLTGGNGSGLMIEHIEKLEGRCLNLLVAKEFHHMSKP